MSERHETPQPRAVGFRLSPAENAAHPGSAPQADGAEQDRRRVVVPERAEPAQESGGPRRFERPEIEDAVWMAFAHASPTRAEVVRVARRHGARAELVELLKGLPSSSFVQLADVWREADAVQRQPPYSIRQGVLRPLTGVEPGGSSQSDGPRRPR